MMIEVLLVARDGDALETSVSSTIDLTTDCPRWSAGLVEAVTSRAHEGAQHLEAQLSERQLIESSRFVPLAAVLPVVEIER
jgi:hypothetical protein